MLERGVEWALAREYSTRELNDRFQSRRQRGNHHNRYLLIVDAAHNKDRRSQDQACRLSAFFTGCANEANEALRSSLLRLRSHSGYKLPEADGVLDEGE